MIYSTNKIIESILEQWQFTNPKKYIVKSSIEPKYADMVHEIYTIYFDVKNEKGKLNKIKIKAIKQKSNWKIILQK